MKTALLSVLEAMMSCDFSVSDIRHLDRTGREKDCTARTPSAAILWLKRSFLA